MDRRLRLLPLLALGLGAAAAQAQVYRWVDADGKTHYADAPPARGSSRVEMTPASPAPAATDWGEKEREFRRRRADYDQAKAKDDQETAARREKACATARAWIAATDGRRVYRVGKDGERIYMGDDERAAAEEKARREVADNCR